MFWNTHSVLRAGWKSETILKWMNNTTLQIMLEDATKKGFRNLPEAFFIGSGDPPGLLADDLRVVSLFYNSNFDDLEIVSNFVLRISDFPACLGVRSYLLFSVVLLEDC